MALEVERKFLVTGDEWRKAEGTVLRQGYLSTHPERTVRVRIKGGKATIAVKGITRGATRSEYEYDIPPEEADELLRLCEPPLIEKVRRRLDHDGHLWVTGRKARRIVSGGVNVHPAEVERVLAAHPAVAEAAVVGLPDPEWGERVAAAIVPAVARELRVQAIHRHCRELLGPAARPRALVVLARLPRNPNGKIDRDRLAARLTGKTPP